MFKQWKSRVCNAHRSVESVNFGEHSASLLESFWNLSIFVASLCLGGVFAKSLPKSLWSLHEFTVQIRVSGRRDDVCTAVFPVIQADSTGSAEVEPPNLYPARPHSGPKDFAGTLRGLSGVLKASPEPPRPRFGASSGRNREEGLTP